MTTQFIMQLLAAIFDWFKAKNPAIAAVVLTVFSILVMNGEAILNGFGITNQTFIDTVRWISLALAALTGSRTTNILAQSEEKKTTV